MSGPTHLGHVHLKVRELQPAVEFYEEVVGLAVNDRHANFAFLSLGDHHHDLALQAVGADAAASTGRPSVGLYHSAWEVPDEEALRSAYERARERGVRVTPVDHGISLALYFDDPDGNGVEVYLDTRERRDRETWGGVNEPFDPAALGNE